MPPRRRTAPITVGRTEALITDPHTGKYPDRTPFRDELVRSLRLASAVWGADTPWTDIDESNWPALIRERLDALIAKDAKAVRAAEITVSRIITAILWLREDKKLIPRDAGLYPRDWKRQIVRRWERVTGLVYEPELARHAKHTVDEARKILNASDFDPRFELLLWLTMGLASGAVARARRKNLELPKVDWTTPDDETKDYGTLILSGPKKRQITVTLTASQRLAVDRALGEGGYLHQQEQRLQEGALKNYLLFPSGYVVGRVAFLRGKGAKMALADTVDWTRPVSGSWIRKTLRTAEERAGVEHILGRGSFRLPMVRAPHIVTDQAPVELAADRLAAIDPADQRIIDTLRARLPSAALSYEQATLDLCASRRHSWRGPATDLREALRETLDYLAPDTDVTAQPGFQLESNTTGPTMKQKVRFILRQRGVSRTAMQTPEAAVEAVEEAVGSFVRSVYTRSSVSTHTPTDRTEVSRVRDWVRAALRELLNIE